MSKNLYSYVVKYDSGFAPNPFFEYCTLATCKPRIRKRAKINDWVIGTGSGAKDVQRMGYLIYAMRVTEILTTMDYWCDERFKQKKPNLYLSWKSASGDNIYQPIGCGQWKQLDSYHSHENGCPNDDHIKRDTKVERVLISEDFAYFGGDGPRLPDHFWYDNVDGQRSILCRGRADPRITDAKAIACFENWFRSLGLTGLQGKPHDWLRRRK